MSVSISCFLLRIIITMNMYDSKCDPRLKCERYIRNDNSVCLQRGRTFYGQSPVYCAVSKFLAKYFGFLLIMILERGIN
jgi:hypothetical protein